CQDTFCKWACQSKLTNLREFVSAMNTNSDLTRLHDYIKEALPWAHGHQVKAITTFVAAIFEKQTGNQAQLARTQHNQEAGCKRLSRLLHNGRLPPKWL